MPQTEFSSSGFQVSFYYSRDNEYKIGLISQPSIIGKSFQETHNILERYRHFLAFVSDKLNELNNDN